MVLSILKDFLPIFSFFFEIHGQFDMHLLLQVEYGDAIAYWAYYRIAIIREYHIALPVNGTQ